MGATSPLDLAHPATTSNSPIGSTSTTGASGNPYRNSNRTPPRTPPRNRCNHHDDVRGVPLQGRTPRRSGPSSGGFLLEESTSSRHRRCGSDVIGAHYAGGEEVLADTVAVAGTRSTVAGSMASGKDTPIPNAVAAASSSARKSPMRAAFGRFLSQSVKAPPSTKSSSSLLRRADPSLSPLHGGVRTPRQPQALDDDGEDLDDDDDLTFYKGDGSTASTDSATSNWHPARNAMAAGASDSESVNLSWKDMPALKDVGVGRNRTAEGILSLPHPWTRRSPAAATASGGTSPLTWSQLGVSSNRNVAGPGRHSGTFELQNGPAAAVSDADGNKDQPDENSNSSRLSAGRSRGKHNRSHSFGHITMPTPSASHGATSGGNSTNTSATSASGSGIFSMSTATVTGSSRSRNSTGRSLRGGIEALSSFMARLSARPGRGAAGLGGKSSGEITLSPNKPRRAGSARGFSEGGRGLEEEEGSGQELIDRLLKESSEEIRAQLGELIIDPSEISVGEVLASGASGEVRKGLFNGQVVAVKILKACGDGREWSALMSEFRREVTALMTIGNCPRLLQFLGVCVTETCRTCIVTRFMEGGSLQDVLRRRRQRLPASVRSCTTSPNISPTSSPISLKGDLRTVSDRKALAYVEATVSEVASPASPKRSPLPLPVALRIAIDVAEGMMFLHSHDMVHRDLKSANILLDAQGRAVVADFGVARLKTDAGEMTNEVGTYRWMAPEAFGATHWPISHLTDVYSYGIVLWEMITGEMPFADCTPVQAAVAVAVHGKQLAVPDSCPKQLKGLMEQCWQKNPEYRPEFVDILSVLKKVLVEVEGTYA